MKTEIKNFLKSNLLGLISLILILSGGTYAAWDSTKSTGSVITASDWNTMVSYIKNGSSSGCNWKKYTGYGCNSCPYGYTGGGYGAAGYCVKALGKFFSNAAPHCGANVGNIYETKKNWTLEGILCD